MRGLTGKARAAAAVAARLRLLGLLFERPRSGWADQVRSLASEQADDRLAALAAVATLAVEGAYLRAFGPGGTASPREVAYRRLSDPGRTMADLSAFYEAYAYRPWSEDPVDHICVETGFAGYLALKEAYALTAGDRAGARRAREAQVLMRTRIRPFAEGLRARLCAGPSPPYLKQAALLLAEWAGCGEGEHQPGSAIPSRDPDEDDDPLTCGGCGRGDPGADVGRLK